MKLEVKAYTALCELEIFTINEINADYNDFGVKEDTGHHRGYRCVNMCFIPKLPTNKVLEKYKITADEYAQVCDKLEYILHFGYCNLCS